MKKYLNWMLVVVASLAMCSAYATNEFYNESDNLDDQVDGVFLDDNEDDELAIDDSDLYFEDQNEE